MIRTKLFLTGALALLLTITSTAAFAQTPANQFTYFTFSAPFELPGGKVLPAGKYVFKVADSPSNRHVIQVMSEDQKTTFATLMAIPSSRQDPAPEPEVRFMETAANTPPAIRTWWYPGRSIGHEFIYPKDHARRLAVRQKEGVLTVASDATSAEQMRTADLARINPSGQETAWNADRRVAENTTSPEQAGTPPPPQPSPAPSGAPATARTTTAADSGNARTSNDAVRTSLPATASPLALIGLLGLASLCGAGALRLRR